jgi:hypothetical protein
VSIRISVGYSVLYTTQHSRIVEGIARNCWTLPRHANAKWGISSDRAENRHDQPTSYGARLPSVGKPFAINSLILCSA